MRCLVVEDDADIRDDLRRALEAAGFTVDAIGDGESAWYRGEVEDYDAAILDLGLPRLDGVVAVVVGMAGHRGQREQRGDGERKQRAEGGGRHHGWSLCRRA